MKKIRLRALTISDLPTTLKWHNQKDVVEMYSGHPFPVNQEMEQKWYDKILFSNIPITVFGIELIEDKRLLGLSFLKDINLIHRKAELAIYIGNPKDRGKGFSKIAIMDTLIFAFESLGLNRIWLKVRDDNIPALALYEKCGFRREGLLRQAIYKNGKYYDEQILAIMREEFEELSEEQEI